MGPLLPYLLLIVPPLCWAGNFVVGRAMHPDIAPLALTFWRWVVAAAVLLPLAGRPLWRQRRVAVRHLGRIGVLAVTGVAVFQFAVYQGLRTTTAISGTLIIATVPVLIPAVAWGLDRTRISGRQAAGIGLSLLGVAIVILKGDLAQIRRFAFLPGDLWMLVAVVAWSLYSVVVRSRPPGLPPLAMLLAVVLVGLGLLLPFWLAQSAGGLGFRPTPATLATILYVGVFASVLAFICWNEGVARIGAARAGLFIHLMPVFTALLAILFLGERLHRYHGVGITLVAAGLLLSSLPGLLPAARNRGRSA